MNRKILFSMAVLAVCMASCDVGTKSNSYRVTFNNICNLIVDETDPAAPAQVSTANYEVNEDYSKYTIDITCGDIVINNNKYSFESDTLAIKPKNFGDKISYKRISRTGNISKGGAPVTDFDGFMAAYYHVASSNILSPSYTFSYSIPATGSYGNNEYFFPLFDYEINDRYHVTTFMQNPCYVGQTYVTEGTGTYSTTKTGYYALLDFSKNTAVVYALGVDLSSTENSETPKVVLIENIPIKLSHNMYSLQAEAPKTSIPGKTSDDKQAFVESDDYKVTDFSLTVTSQDLTDVSISYKIAGKLVNFTGCSILKKVD